MTLEQFKKDLSNQKYITVEEKDGRIVVSKINDYYDDGQPDRLEILSTTIPDNVTFVGNVFIEFNGLTSLPPSTKFYNGGGMYFWNLKILPDGVEFNNGRRIYFYMLETLPPSTKFNNTGELFFYSMKSIPKGIEFNNKGAIVFSSLESVKQIYGGQEIELHYISDYGRNVIIDSTAIIKGYEVSEVRVFSGGAIEDFPKQLMVKEREYKFVMGDTEKDIVDELNANMGDFRVFKLHKVKDFKI